MQPIEVVSTMTPLQVFQKALHVQLLSHPQNYAVKVQASSAQLTTQPSSA
jgi:hypothetical protein